MPLNSLTTGPTGLRHLTINPPITYENLYQYLKFSEESGTTAEDTRNNQNGAIEGSGVVVGEPGPGDEFAYEFPGDTDYGYVNTNVDPGFISRPCSINIYIYWYNDTTERNKIFGGYNGGSNRWECEIDMRNNVLRMVSYGDSFDISTSPPNANEWVHLGANFSSSGEELFVNGSLVGTYSGGSSLDDGANYWLGARQSDHEDSFGGRMTNWGLYDRTLTDEEMAEWGELF